MTELSYWSQSDKIYKIYRKYGFERSLLIYERLCNAENWGIRMD